MCFHTKGKSWARDSVENTRGVTDTAVVKKNQTDKRKSADVKRTARLCRCRLERIMAVMWKRRKRESRGRESARHLPARLRGMSQVK